MANTPVTRKRNGGQKKRTIANITPRLKHTRSVSSTKATNNKKTTVSGRNCSYSEKNPRNLRVKITDNNKVPKGHEQNPDQSLGKRPTPIQRRLKIKLRAYSTLSAAKVDESLSQTALSDSEDRSLANSKQLLDISKIMEKYFNNNDQLSYVMEKMVSDLTAKVVDERQKNANRACGEVTSSSGNETFARALCRTNTCRNKYHSRAGHGFRYPFWIETGKQKND